MRLLNLMLRRFVQIGTLCIIDAAGHSHVHKGRDGPAVTIKLTDPKLYLALFLNPELSAGEAYMDRILVIEEGAIRDLLTIFGLNRESLRGQPLQRSLRRLSGGEQL